MRRTLWPPTVPGLAAGRCTRAAVVAALVLVTPVSGCGGDPAADAAAATTAAGVGTVTTAEDGVQEITVQTQDDYEFVPDRFSVAPGRVRLTVVNVAEEMTHNLEFREGEGPEEITEGVSILSPGEEKTVEFDVTAPGEHRFECTFHVQLGQVGTMTVRG